MGGAHLISRCGRWEGLELATMSFRGRGGGRGRGRGGRGRGGGGYYQDQGPPEHVVGNNNLGIIFFEFVCMQRLGLIFTLVKMTWSVRAALQGSLTSMLPFISRTSRRLERLTRYLDHSTNLYLP